MPYVIKNKRTGKWLYGTDYRYTPARQKTSYTIAKMFENETEAIFDMKHRQCGKDYTVVEVELKELL